MNRKGEENNLTLVDILEPLVSSHDCASLELDLDQAKDSSI